MNRFPDNFSPFSPHVRFSNFHKGSLFVRSIEGSDSNSANRQFIGRDRPLFKFTFRRQMDTFLAFTPRYYSFWKTKAFTAHTLAVRYTEAMFRAISGSIGAGRLDIERLTTYFAYLFHIYIITCWTRDCHLLPLRAVKLGRAGMGIELNSMYHRDAVYWMKREEQSAGTPSLFDIFEGEELAVKKHPVKTGHIYEPE